MDVEKDISREKFSKITKQVGFNYATIIAQILLAPVLVALLTRTLSVSEYGVYSLLMVFVFFSVSFFELGLSQFIITKLSGQEELERIKAFFSIAKFEAIFIAAALLIFLLSPLGDYFLKINRLASYGTELKICAAIVFAATMLRLFNSFFKAIKRINTANFLDMFFNKGWALILLAAFLLLGRFTLKTVFQIWLAGAAIAFAAAIWLLRKEIRQYMKMNAKFHLVKKSLRFSIPLILVIIANWFLAMSNRYILNFYTTTAVVGIFTVAYSLMGVVTTFSTTISQVIQPYFTEAFMKKEKQDVLINTSLKYGLMLVLPATVAGVVWREQIILLISGSRYLPAAPLMPALALYPLFALIAFIFYQVLIAAEKTKYVGLMHLIGAILSVALNFMLIPVLGMMGAAIGTVLSYGFLAFAMAIPGRKYIKIYISFLRIPRILVASALMGALLFFAKPQGSIEKIGVMLFAGLFYLVLILIMKVIGSKEAHVLKKLTPRIFYPAIDYFTK